MRITVVACVNPRSGGLKGAKVLTSLKKILGPRKCLNVLDGVEAADWLFENFSNEEGLRILICGGDGTLSRVLDGYAQTLSSLVENESSVAARELRRVASSWAFVPIPIGTGNDLARTLGWGSNLTAVSVLFFESVVRFVTVSHPLPIDVWLVTRQRPLRTQVQKRRSGFHMCLSPENAHTKGESDACSMSHEQNDTADSGSSAEPGPLEKTEHARKFTMLSYLSLGCDADVELLFNSRRDANPNRYRSQTLNFISHAIFGVERTFLSPARPLYREHIKLFVDGRRVQIPRGAQSLLIANIPSYGAGADPGGITRRQRRAFAKKPRQPFWTCSCLRGEQHERNARSDEPIELLPDGQPEEVEALDERSDANEGDTRNSAIIAARVANQFKATTDRSEPGLILSYVDDRQLDVMAMDSLFHFIWIKLGREARRLASGSVIRIELEEKLSPVVRAAPSVLAKHIAVQCDGEAWKQARNEVIQIEPYSFQVCFILGPLYREARRRLDANTRAEREFVGHYLKSTSAPCGVFSQKDSVQYIQRDLQRARGALLLGATSHAEREPILSEHSVSVGKDSRDGRDAEPSYIDKVENSLQTREPVKPTEPNERSRFHHPRRARQAIRQLFACFGMGSDHRSTP